MKAELLLKQRIAINETDFVELVVWGPTKIPAICFTVGPISVFCASGDSAGCAKGAYPAYLIDYTRINIFAERHAETLFVAKNPVNLIQKV